MTLGEALRLGRRTLAGAAIDEADLAAELLLRHALRIDRAALFSRLDVAIDGGTLAAYRALIERRLAREPVAYITGRREFYGLDLEVTSDVLIPRPETELLVEAALRRVCDRPTLIVDVGTGSGAIAIAIAANSPHAHIIATDVSSAALWVAAANTRRLAPGRVDFVQAGLLAGLRGPFDAIAANLPYVPTAEWEALPPEIRDHEPRAAVEGGPDGLEPLRRLLEQAPERLAPAGSLLAEIGAGQGSAALALARAAFPKSPVAVRKDAAGLDRLLVIG